LKERCIVDEVQKKRWNTWESMVKDFESLIETFWKDFCETLGKDRDDDLLSVLEVYWQGDSIIGEYPKHLSKKESPQAERILQAGVKYFSRFPIILDQEGRREM